MSQESRYNVLPADQAVLRELAKRVREACESPRNQECRRLWYQHDLCKGERPLIVTELDGGLEMVMPDFHPRCTDKWACQQERELTELLAHFEIIQDDLPLEPYANTFLPLVVSDFGVTIHETKPVTDGTRGAVHIDAAITDLEKEFHKLRPRTFAIDRQVMSEHKAALEHVYDGLLGVRRSRNPWWTLGLTNTAIMLIGLENIMLYMYDQPEALHKLMAFIRDENLRLVDWLEREGLLVLNNENHYCGSGSYGYTRDLPAAGFDGKVRPKDLWTLLESQETVGVGPEKYGEFIFPYEEAIAKRFGKVYYGCCEPLHTRWNVVSKMPNLKRASVSPWCDEAFMASALGDRYVYSRKPKPTLVSTERFDEDLIRQDIRHTLDTTRPHGCTVEFAMKDVHTLSGQSNRLTRWVQIAREEIAR